MVSRFWFIFDGEINDGSDWRRCLLTCKTLVQSFNCRHCVLCKYGLLAGSHTALVLQNMSFKRPNSHSEISQFLLQISYLFRAKNAFARFPKCIDFGVFTLKNHLQNVKKKETCKSRLHECDFWELSFACLQRMSHCFVHLCQFWVRRYKGV